MNPLASRLVALQQADSFFPAGTAAFSGGLESLMADQRLPSAPASPTADRRGRARRRQAQGETLAAFIGYQLANRWNSFDRAFLHAAWLGTGDEEGLLRLDCQLEAMSLAREMREASRRNGASLLRVHAELGTRGAQRLQRLVANGNAHGHLPIMQGVLWRNLGMDWDDCQLAAAHGFCTSLVSAALRLGLLGHVEAQRVLGGLQPGVLALLAEQPLAPDEAHSFIPLTEIAMMRHEHQALRLFAN